VQIKSEQGIASGIRRIEAVAGPSALEFLYERESVVRELTNQLKVTSSELPARVQGSSTRVIPFNCLIGKEGVSRSHCKG